MIAYRARLDVPRELVWFVARLLLAERHRRGTPRGSRALTCFWQAVVGLRWFRDRTSTDALARDHGISRATAYPLTPPTKLPRQTPGRQGLAVTLTGTATRQGPTVALMVRCSE